MAEVVHQDAIDQLDGLNIGEFNNDDSARRLLYISAEAEADFAAFTHAESLDFPNGMKENSSSEDDEEVSKVTDATTTTTDSCSKEDDQSTAPTDVKVAPAERAGKCRSAADSASLLRENEDDLLNRRFVAPKDFELLKVIGMGAFGKVLQVRNKKSKSIYAMKVISKRLLRTKGGYIENVQAERNILTKVRHPFVVAMHCSFQSREKLFIVMSYLAGGELFLRIGREGIFSEKEAAFYLAEIILALDHLHQIGIMHRDLKPENILLGSDGHVCVTDFGLAKDFSDDGGFDDDEKRAHTICGTREYMAPEMVAHKGYGRACDYWSLGCMTYEMLSGLPPFQTKLGAKELFRKIMTERVKMPAGSTSAACKLLKGLLNRDVQKRWGTNKSTMFEVGGVAGLKAAEFFKGIDWDALVKKEIEPPITLSVSGEEDLQHFHEEFTGMALPRSVVEMSRDDFRPCRVKSDNFRGFSFIQEDFDLPERGREELDCYWVAPIEDGESVSDCASSKMDFDAMLADEPTQQEKKKKRPPRKKKKKAGAASAETTPLHSAATTPMHSTVTTPAHSVADYTPVPSENGDIVKDTFENSQVDAASPATLKRTEPLEEKQADANKPSPARPRVQQVVAPAPAPAPALKPVGDVRQSVSSPTKKPGMDTKAVVQTQQQLHPQERSENTPTRSTTANALHPQNQSTFVAVGGTSKSCPWAQRTEKGNTRQHPGGQPHQPPQQPAPQGRWPKPAAAVSSDWRQHDHRTTVRPLQWGEPPSPPAETPPSSDWRQHNMSALSTTSLRKQHSQQGPSWPSLSPGDPPLPTKGGTPKKAEQHSANLQGAWASRTKR